MQHLYLHVPFCPTICPYCDFHVVRRYGDVVEAYLKRLAQEARGLFEQHPGPLTTLYLGGGTPSFLRSHELEALFRALPWNIEAAEVTLEANPGTLNPERLGLLRELGVNRISLGVQSFQDSVLKTLGRAHGRTGALRAVEMSLEAGFHTSIDLILGLPGQDVEADLAQATALGVEHVSAYTLQVEPGTPFALRGLAPDPDSEAQALALAQEVLGTAGLARYEVSNLLALDEKASTTWPTGATPSGAGWGRALPDSLPGSSRIFLQCAIPTPFTALAAGRRTLAGAGWQPRAPQGISYAGPAAGPGG